MRERPAFVVQIATNYTGNGALLQHARPLGPGQELLGRYACFPLDARAYAAEELRLRTEGVTLSLEVGRDLLQAFHAGAASAASIDALAAAVRAATPKVRR